jgi:hypothetical protein
MGQGSQGRGAWGELLWSSYVGLEAEGLARASEWLRCAIDFCCECVRASAMISFTLQVRCLTEARGSVACTLG